MESRSFSYNYFHLCWKNISHYLQISSITFHKSSFFFNYLTLLYDSDQLQYLLVHCFGIRISSVLLLCSNKNPLCALWCFRISVFSCDSSITFNMLTTCASQTYKKLMYITGKTLTVKPLKISNNIWLSASCYTRSKHLKPGLKHLHAAVCQWPYRHLTYFLVLSFVSCLPQNLILKRLHFSPTARSLYDDERITL